VYRFLSLTILIVLMLCLRCSEPVEHITLVNDTAYTVELTYHNVTIASTENLSLAPGENAIISLKGIWSTSSFEKIGQSMRDNLVIRKLKHDRLRLALKGDEALKKITENVRKENDAWTIRLSNIFE
jgi:hypothetical protein